MFYAHKCCQDSELFHFSHCSQWHRRLQYSKWLITMSLRSQNWLQDVYVFVFRKVHLVSRSVTWMCQQQTDVLSQQQRTAQCGIIAFNKQPASSQPCCSSCCCYCCWRWWQWWRSECRTAVAVCNSTFYRRTLCFPSMVDRHAANATVDSGKPSIYVLSSIISSKKRQLEADVGPCSRAIGMFRWSCFFTWIVWCITFNYSIKRLTLMTYACKGVMASTWSEYSERTSVIDVNLKTLNQHQLKAVGCKWQAIRLLNFIIEGSSQRDKFLEGNFLFRLIVRPLVATAETGRISWRWGSLLRQTSDFRIQLLYISTTQTSVDNNWRLRWPVDLRLGTGHQLTRRHVVHWTIIDIEMTEFKTILHGSRTKFSWLLHCNVDNTHNDNNVRTHNVRIVRFCSFSLAYGNYFYKQRHWSPINFSFEATSTVVAMYKTKYTTATRTYIFLVSIDNCSMRQA